MRSLFWGAVFRGRSGAHAIWICTVGRRRCCRPGPLRCWPGRAACATAAPCRVSSCTTTCGRSGTTPTCGPAPRYAGHLYLRLLGQGHGRERQPQVLPAALRPHLQVSPSPRSCSEAAGSGDVGLGVFLFLIAYSSSSQPRFPPRAATTPLSCMFLKPLLWRSGARRGR